MSPSSSDGARARAAAEKIARKQKRSLSPVGPIEGNKIVRTFWGKAWCENLESYGDYANRLPRGRSYVRHGRSSICRSGAARSLRWSAVHRPTWSPSRSDRFRRRPGASSRPNVPGTIDSLVDLLRGSSAGASHGAGHAQAGRPVSCAEADLIRMLVPGLGRHVQARGCHALQGGRPPGREAGAVLRASRCRPHRARWWRCRRCPTAGQRGEGPFGSKGEGGERRQSFRAVRDRAGLGGAARQAGEASPAAMNRLMGS